MNSFCSKNLARGLVYESLVKFYDELVEFFGRDIGSASYCILFCRSTETFYERYVNKNNIKHKNHLEYGLAKITHAKNCN